MDQLLAMRVFIRITDARSLAKAADSLNLPRSSVSKLLQDLEQHLGTKLIERSTRGQFGYRTLLYVKVVF
ncbi:helix-turn-helix domain-containing protein [Pantoea agglomerans]|jgi:DNA-binding transcriptional LysR family regulator